MEESKKDFINFNERQDSALYISFQAHAGKGVEQEGTSQTSIHSLIENYKGPEIYLDFDIEGRLRGIEILGDG